ncbi:MAG: TIGR03915 family putative DNA repair protein [Gemmatimonadaceae bacterium]
MITAAVMVPERLSRWRRDARRSLAAQIPPDQLEWFDDGSATRLFGDPITEAAHDLGSMRVPRHFVALAGSVACNRDPVRWSLLYSLLWRLTHGESHILQVASDPLVHRLIHMHRAVRRAAHKMKAFVRFRAMRHPDSDEEEFVSWFEPAHCVVERTAPFFVRRFPSMRWSILTPDGCARWDGESLQLSDGIERHLAPTDEDSQDELWRTYYAAIFNPARLNRTAMRAEMPVRYWKNLPEAALIGTLTREAPGRVAAMIAQTLAPPTPIPDDLDAIESMAASAPAVSESGWHPVHDPGWTVARRRADALPLCAAAPLKWKGSEIFTGVAGWTDPTLIADDVFYPPGATNPEPRLRFYASQLSMVEVDATYYAMPSEETARRWVERTPDHFCFDIKAHALMTGHPTSAERLPPWLKEDLPIRLRAARNVYSHHFSREAIDEVWQRFLSALAPLHAAGKLGAIMLQYPRWFTPTREAAARLSEAREHLGDMPASVELRHRDWLSDRIAPRTFRLLRELSFSYVAVDAPPGMESSMPPTFEVTNSDLAIIRLHGRRTATWETRNEIVTERYRYLYQQTQLASWLSAIQRAADGAMRVHLTFNNNHANYATTNAREMYQLLAEVV